MKNILKLLLGTFLAAVFLFSCKKDENKLYFEGGTAPALTANKNAIEISYIDKDNDAISFSWTNPNYKLATGVSSQDVNYILEIDTAGANFTNPKRKQISIAKDLSKVITQGNLNDYLLNQLELAADVTHNIEVRIVSVMGTSEPTKLISNVLKYAVKPYSIPPKVAPPETGQLFLVGSASPGGWNNPVPEPTQKFTKISSTLYELTISISGGNSYLFLPLNGSWNTKYGFDGANNTNNPGGDNLKIGGGDMLAPAASGNYKIEVNFQTGKFKLTKL